MPTKHEDDNHKVTAQEARKIEKRIKEAAEKLTPNNTLGNEIEEPDENELEKFKRLNKLFKEIHSGLIDEFRSKGPLPDEHKMPPEVGQAVKEAKKVLDESDVTQNE